MFSEIIIVLLILSACALTLGVFLNKTIKMPWMFSLVILGMVLSPFSIPFFSTTVNSAEFRFFSKLGMMGFLFLIGLNLELEKIKEFSGYISFSTIILALTEGTAIAMIIYFFFPADVGYSLPVAILVGYGFGTIGEVVLLAILMEFRVEGTKFGQITLGMGVVDDIIEIFLIALLAVIPGVSSQSGGSILVSPLFIILNLIGLVILLIINIKVGKKIQSILKKQNDSLQKKPFIVPFLFLFVFFSYFFLGSITSENLGFVGAVFAGLGVKAIIPGKMMEKHKNFFKYAIMFVLSPAFFFSMGYKISLFAIMIAPLLIVVFVLISVSIRISGSILIYRKKLGPKRAALLGVGLCSKFSTSIIILTILNSSGLLSVFMFSVLMGSYLIMKPIIVIVYSWGISKYLSPETPEQHDKERIRESQLGERDWLK
ncbi:MAG: cation:proton antiporter [Promethearchaeia archaeon]